MWVHMRSKLGWKEIGNCINNELYWRYTLLRVHHGTDAYSLWTIVNNRHQLHLFLVYVCFGYLLDYLTLAVMSNRSANVAPLCPFPWNLENTSRVCWFFGGLPPFFSLLHFLLDFVWFMLVCSSFLYFQQVLMQLFYLPIIIFL